ncbi:MAG: ABC transporter permease [Candidatus Zixiibacteriota bacterium]|nr:MAG: ABC transporter permease [candidate division Zixibacteria bacterium]
MLTFMKLAWRNLFRNKRRTFIAGSAIGIGLASLIFIDALIIGMKDNLVHSATSSFLGEGQIHHREFRQTHDVELTIVNHERLAADLRREEIISRFTERTMALGMITSPANVNSVSVFGINPATERNLSQIDEALVAGSYFEDGNDQDILIGSKLAEILEVELGDRVVLTVAQAYTGDLSQELFRISGIYHFNIREMDRAMAFIRIGKAQQMLGLGNKIHEIALKFAETRYGSAKDLPFWRKYSRDGNEAAGWPMILPQLQAAFEISQFSTFLIGLILFAVVALGIINTLFMSMHERMFEFGVLRAVGTRPFTLGRLILFEAGALAVISIILGMILGFAVTYIVSKIGIDYMGIEFVGAYFRELLYPVLQMKQFIYFPFYVFVFTMITGLYPALYAAKISPAEAMRKGL